MIEHPGKKTPELVLLHLKQQRGICKPRLCAAAPSQNLLREPLGASLHLPAPAPPLPFLGKKIPACLLSAAEKGLVRIDAVWLLVQTSAGGERGAGWPSG